MKMTHKLTFDEWIKQVNKITIKSIGVSADNLMPDFPFRSDFDNNETPGSTSFKIINKVKNQWKELLF